MNVSKIIWRLIDYSEAILPGRWRLPLRYFTWIISGNVEPELVHLFDLCKNYRCAIDIGANHGFYAYKMLQRFEQVYAFDANSSVDFDISHYKKPNLHFFQFGLSDQNTKRDLNIPVHAGVAYDGWASLEDRSLSFADDFKQIPVSLQRLDDQPFTRAFSIDLIKIDVEGHELEVLRGAQSTIMQHKPVLIIERNKNQAEIGNLLIPLGYRCSNFSELFGKALASPNLIYIPI